MSARLIDGKALAAQLRATVAAAVARLPRAPRLAIVLVGTFEPSRIYVAGKLKAGAACNIQIDVHRFAETISEVALLKEIARLNTDDQVDAILVQMPLPPQVDKQNALAAVAPAKDVDGLTLASQGWLAAGQPPANKTTQTGFLPCTPKGCLLLIDSALPDLRGVEAVVVGRSQLVGQPLALLLSQRGATVTIAHSATRDLASHTRRAELVCLAAGVPGLLTGAMVQPGATVIDIGINRVAGQLVGDADFASVAAVAGAITPVPGGVGPMTIACLLENTLLAAQRRLTA